MVCCVYRVNVQLITKQLATSVFLHVTAESCSAYEKKTGEPDRLQLFCILLKSVG